MNYLYSVVQTSDGGYLLAGNSTSNISGDKSENCIGSWDYWIIKTDANGDRLWDKTIGGIASDQLTDAIQTDDGGYLLAGVSSSNISDDKTENSKGNNDYWIVKTDVNGNKQWDKTFGGSDSDIAFSIIQANDGGYLLGGQSKSNISGDKSENSKGGYDYWIVKLGTPNQPPVANDDNYEMYGNTLTITAPGVLVNDTDANSDPLTVQIVTQPTKGTVVLNADGSFTYTIGANFDGNDSFTYKANDGTDDSNVATVNIKHMLYVTNLNDSGDGSLRWTITNANSHSGADEIRFAVAGTINTLSQLPTLNDASGGTTIDGTTAPGYAGEPVVVLSGPGASGSVNYGVYITSANNEVKALEIVSFRTGIYIIGASDNIITGNYIGTDGTVAIPNGSGISVNEGAGNVIGGTTIETRNVISGNNGYGIYIRFDATGTKIQGNLIGTDATGTLSIGNYGGIQIYGPNNNIGGTMTGAGNVISGNIHTGIQISQPSTENYIQGNIIGLDVTGSTKLGNVSVGLYINNSPNNFIGGTTTFTRNIISANKSGQIKISGDLSTNNLIQGNFIGTDITGMIGLGEPIYNGGYYGINIERGSGNIIGGTTPVTRNVISGNGSSGISLWPTCSGTIVKGNFIGINAAGTGDLGNEEDGIYVSGIDHIIGGTEPGSGNVISGNNRHGIYIAVSSSEPSGLFIQGNLIGTNSEGTNALGNSEHGIYVPYSNKALIGGTLSGSRNIISGNIKDGIHVESYTATDITIQGNFIGTDISGTLNLGNLENGIFTNVNNTTIGGTSPEARNIISGNKSYGIYLNSTNNVIQGNFVGTDVTSTVKIGNNNGIFVVKSENLIGGTITGTGNVISGNKGQGLYLITENNLVQGNFIGTDISGTLAVGNTVSGIAIQGSNNIIGGIIPEARNIISGNDIYGVQISGNNNQIFGNYIGTDITGNIVLGNVKYGIHIGGSYNVVGGIDFGSGNKIAFNGENGVRIWPGIGNRITGNSIFLNGQLGIDLYPTGINANDLGDGDTGANNKQNYPEINSISADEANTTIEGTLNSLPNTTFTIEFFSNSSADPSGYGEGEHFIGSATVTTDGNGDTDFMEMFPVVILEGEFVTATATDPDGNTSEFSAALEYIACEPPVALCKDITLQLDNSGHVNITADDIDNRSEAPCGLNNISIDQTSFDCTNIGTNTVTLTITDINGASSTCVAIVTVNDITAPVPNVVLLPDLTAECEVTSLTSPTATDNCAGTVTAFHDAILPINIQGTTLVTWTFDDGNGNPTTQTQTVVVDDVTAPTVLTKNITVQLDDYGTASITASAVDNGSFDNCGIASMNISQNIFTCENIGDNTVTLTVTDIGGNQSSSTAIVTVSYGTYEIGSVTGPEHPIPLGTSISLAINLIAPVNANVKVIWDDGMENIYNGSTGTIYADHIYQTTGVFSVTVQIEDPCSQSEVYIFNYIVIYDPDGGFVTGGGWIESPEGAYKPDPLLTGKANFGFVAKYKKGSTTPDGKTEFQYKAGNLNFNSSDYEYLTINIAGAKALIKGSGTINRSGNYGFMLSAIDADLTPSVENDKFRIKIWDKNLDVIVYDNNIDGEDNADPATEIGGGSITIHSNDNKSAEILTTVKYSNLKVYPNPFSNKLKFEFISPEDTHARIDLFDATGRKVCTLFDNPVKGGVYYNAEFEPVSEISGMYFYRMTLGEAVYNDVLIYRKE